MADSQQPTLFAEEEIAGKSIGADTVSGNSRGKRQKKVKEPLTSKQQLSSIIKSVRDDLRKDAGLSGDTDRLPQLTWLLFLKSFNDFEEAYQEMLGESYVPAIETPYRWRDWADVENKADRKTGDELLEFVNNELIPYLARLSGPDERDIRTIVGTIFQGTSNRIRSGYILRSVVDKLSAINFTLSDDAHAVSHFYETMLKEMRDAAGDSGEFYTPRPVVRFIINRLKPKLGERIMDPACGTAGFLVEAYEQLKGEVRTPDQRRMLEDSLIGTEKKPMPYLLGVMNMRLHGIETPHLSERNALAVNVRQIKEAERVDVIATNPPFGGAEEQGILNNFPDGFRTAETAILFFQYVMAMLKRPGGRCGIVLPNGFLFGNGVAAVIKKQLLTRFNLHTIVRLPNGAFAPYTNIPTNLLFFEACEIEALDAGKMCTSEVWYYEIPLPEGRSNYTKTKPMLYEEFEDCITWWNNRVENEHAWKITIEELIANDYNLDIKNPRTPRGLEYMPPENLIDSILGKVLHASELAHEIGQIVLSELDAILSPTKHSTVAMGDVATLVKRPKVLQEEEPVRNLGVKWWGKGPYIAEVKDSLELRADRFEARANDLIYNDMWARHGSVGIVPASLDGCVASAHFPTWELDQNRVYPPFFAWCFRAPWFWAECEAKSQGSTGRNAISKTEFKRLVMPLPDLEE